MRFGETARGQASHGSTYRGDEASYCCAACVVSSVGGSSEYRGTGGAFPTVKTRTADEKGPNAARAPQDSANEE